MNTDTPRTDKLIAWCANNARYKAPEQMLEVMAGDISALTQLARELEQELTAQPNKEKELRGALERIKERLASLHTEDLTMREELCLDDAIAALLATPPAAPRTEGTSDTEMLDWLENQRAGVNFGPVDHPNEAHVWVERPERRNLSWDMQVQHYYGSNYRQAIILAMALKNGSAADV